MKDERAGGHTLPERGGPDLRRWPGRLPEHASSDKPEKRVYRTAKIASVVRCGLAAEPALGPDAWLPADQTARLGAPGCRSEDGGDRLQRGHRDSFP
ncbi:hypothetical protein SAMN05444168_2923 [Paraburkholderia phenazinium]|jgi:hypothetical protein|uniref:Uncharacterized protein n=1 Tax=Paraburkholderia phenazinium TaxID=60549 RepID=A0A1N6H2C0_9BURK|nr:hypothetical protein SAMN05444168_2923 [Paraburkholderia phenazinium]